MHVTTTPRQVWHLLNRHQRRSAFILLGLMLIGMMLETLGVGLVIPTMAMLSQADPAARYPALVPVLTALHTTTREQMAVAAMLILVAVFAIKTAFVAFLSWKQQTFAFTTQVDISDRLFLGYLRQPYTFHLQRNSAQLIQIIAGETSIFVQAVLTSALLLLTETFVIIGVSVLLLFVEPVGAVVVALVLGIAMWGFSRMTREPLRRWGEQRQLHDGVRLQHLQQGLSGAKDVKVLGREDDFAAQYNKHSGGSARVNARAATMQQIPRLWLELLAVGGLAALVLIMIGRGRSLETVVPTLALFGAAAFRLMPSVNRVLGAIQNLRFSRPVVNTLYSEIRNIEETPALIRQSLLPFNQSLTLKDVSFRYPGSTTYALRSVSLSIPQGSCVGFIGSSGAGKSTLVDVVLGLLAPTEGAVEVDGVDIRTNLRGWQDQIGYVPQVIYLTDDSLRRNVAFGLPEEQIDDNAVQQAIRAAQLDQFVAQLPDGLNTPVGERGVRLSGGQRQRIGIARALYHDPAVLVLDEATSSLDTPTESGVMEAVRALRGNKTLIIVAHRLSTVEQCERLFRLEHGDLVEQGNADTVLRNLQTSNLIHTA
jgi:ATP-binding cassette, subfamily B, bacterial PglK